MNKILLSAIFIITFVGKNFADVYFSSPEVTLTKEVGNHRQPIPPLLYNNECDEAIILPVNATSACSNVVSVTFAGTTASPEPVCSGVNGADIWFKFTAQAPTHLITLKNFVIADATAQPIVLSLYDSNNCAGLGTPLYCSLNNAINATGLVSGTEYTVRASINATFPNLATGFDVCVSTPEMGSGGGTCLVTTVNFDFEEPAIGLNNLSFINHNAVPGWRTTASDQMIEFWSSSFQGVTAYSGSQFVELNANVVSGVYQDYVAPEGTVFNYGFAHRGRLGTDTCRLRAGPPGGPYVAVGAPVSTGNTAWSYNQGTYTVPAGQPVTRFIFESVSSTGGSSIGNFLDAISFTANTGILTQSPLQLNCDSQEIAVEAVGAGNWIAHNTNPSPTVIAEAGSNTTTISGFTVPGEYHYDWTTPFCNNTLIIYYPGGNIPELVVTDVEYCEGAVSEALTATALQDHTLNWYSDAGGTIVLPNAPVPDTNVPGTVVYYVSQSNENGCESPLAPITVTIHPLVVPVAAFNYEAFYCSDEESVLPTLAPGFTTGGVFSASDGLAIDAATGEVDISGNLPGTYTVTYTVEIISECSEPVEYTDTFTINTVPSIADPLPLEVCDDNNDGFASFDLTQNTAVITGGNPDLVVTYYETLENATLGGTPIQTPSSYNNININTQTIYFNAAAADTPDCGSVGFFQITVNERPVLNNSIPAYELCDENNPGDGLEVFDLTTMYNAITNSQPGFILTFAYDNAGTIVEILNPLAFENTVANQQTILVTAENSLGCFSTTSFNVIVNPLPQISDPLPLFACSDGISSDIAPFDLSIRNNDITGDNPDMTVTYHETLTDAEQGLNALPIPYTNTVNGQIIFVRVENTITGCVSTTSLELNVIEGPVAIIPQPIHTCDVNNDGFASFDLTQVIAEVTGGLNNVTVTFHETFTDADLQGTVIASATNYSNIVSNQQTVYIRVDSDLTECHDVVALLLIVDPTPEAVTPSDLEVCDNNADGIAVFNLTVVIPEVLNGMDPTLHTVTFYNSQAAANAGTNPITNVTSFTNTVLNQQIIWVRVTINATGCYDVVPLTLIVHSLPVVPIVLPSYSLCETDPTDERESFDLVAYVGNYLTDAGMAISFHFSQADALANINPLPEVYTNQVNPQTIWIRSTNSTTGCFRLTMLDLRVEPRPVLDLPLTPIVFCDADGNGFGSFDLDDLKEDLLNGATGVTITFHETLTNAELDVSPLASPYQNIVSYVEFIFIRAEDDATGCYRTYMLELNVYAAPVLPNDLPNLVLCDQDSNSQNGQTSFNLSAQTPIILAAQTPGDYTVRYFTSEVAANANTSAIINITNYQNTSNPQTIWYRIQDNTTDCFTLGSFELIVNTPLLLMAPPALALCDDNSDGFQTFDLTIRDELISQGLDNHTVTYYPSYAGALAQTNPILNPSAYTNIVNPQTLGVVVTTPEGCTSVTIMTIRVLNLPTPNVNPPSLVACDDEFPGDGQTLFDLTTHEDFIAANDNNLTFAYYPTEQDAIGSSNEIVDPANYTGVSGFIWIKVMNQQLDYTGDACFVLVAQELIVNPQPAITEDLVYPICMRNSTGVAEFTLSSMNAAVLGSGQNPADYSVSYYLTAADAAGGSNSLLNLYTNIANPQEIFIRVENNSTGCVNPVGALTLIVEEGAIANPVDSVDPALTQCDTDGDNNGQTAFDLTQFTATILAGNPAGVTIHYYDTMTDLDADLAAGLGIHDNAIADPANYVNTIPLGQEVYALLVNMDTTTGCPDIIAIPLTVNLLPEPILTDGLVCIDSETGNVLRDYTIDTGLDEATHSFEWTHNGTLLGATTSSITVTASGTYTVVATDLITGCASETVTAFVAQSEPANVTATVSNAFTDNQIITVTVTGVTVGGVTPNYVYALDFGPFQTSNIFTQVSPGNHTITVSDLNGCGETTISVTAINYPNYFTPNADNYNDTWNIIGLSSQPDARIYIFDRYGKLLKQISPAGDGWDGTYNGQPMFSTDYWFKVTYREDGQAKEFGAHFSLKR